MTKEKKRRRRRRKIRSRNQGREKTQVFSDTPEGSLDYFPAETENLLCLKAAHTPFTSGSCAVALLRLQTDLLRTIEKEVWRWPLNGRETTGEYFRELRGMKESG